jgi:hypothetical protein
MFMTDPVTGAQTWVQTTNVAPMISTTANVVPLATWTHEQVVDFAKQYPDYCYEIAAAGIVPASLFAGIELPVPNYAVRPTWRWSNLVAYLKGLW